MTIERKIITHYVFPPIPERQFDYIAYYEGQEESGRYGHGATKDEAIKDLLDNYGEDR